MRSHRGNTATFLIASLLAIGVLGGVAAPAGADPIADKQAEARAIEEQIAANNQEITALGEQYNAAQLALEEAETTIADAQARLDATRAEVRRIRRLVRKRAASVYRRALSGGSLRDFDYADAASLIARRQYADQQAEQDNALLDQLATAKRQLAEQRAAAEDARTAADAQRQQIASAQADVEAATAQHQELLGKVNGEIAQLVEAERKRREAEALAAALRMISAQSSAPDADGNPQLFPNVPPPGPAAAAAIEWGRTQLGKPYRYAASGPDSYDCSGFTMAAYAHAGISMPHYSGAQYAKFPHVPLDKMLPGDLVAWGPGGSSHVAIYLGAGMIIEAGGDGDNVNIGPIWGRPSGAARPA